jgi:hypothetical protein
MQVDRETAVKITVAGETLYFCSDHCRRAYEHGNGTRAQPDAVEDCAPVHDTR